MAKLRDDEIKAICEAEIDSASGWYSGELSGDRADALDRYLGEPEDVIEGRSQVVTRDVLDTIEWIKPSLMRIFADRENCVEFDPVGPEDEDQAEQETDMVGHVFWKQNRGFFNVLTFITDGLLSKTGILKTWWDDTPWEEREEYRGLDDMQLMELLQDEAVDREVLEFEQEEDGYHIVCIAKSAEGRVRIEPTAPEEFGVNRDARTPYAKDCTFCYHRTRKTRSELIEMGYPRREIEDLPSLDDLDTEEELARRNLDDEQDALRYAVHKSMQVLWITECYLRLDRNDDGVAELIKVTLAAGGQGSAASSVILDVEEVDRVPFATFSPIILTHKFFGLSIADLVMDLQEIRTALLRALLDNTYLSVNGRTAINDNVDQDDALTSRPGGLIRVDGKEPPSSSIMPIPPNPPPPETYQLLEYIDSERRDRTGVGDEVAALDPKALANINTGVAALAYDAARSKIELIARIVAEIGFRTVFQDVHELLSKNATKRQTVRLRGKWVQVHPGGWRRRENMTVKVGLGVASKERRMFAHEKLMEWQAAAVEGGGLGIVITPEHLLQNVQDATRELGLEPSKYWAEEPIQQQPQEQGLDPQMMALQLAAQTEQAKAATAHERNKVEMVKVQGQQQIAQLELEAKERETTTRAAIENTKAEVAALKAQSDASGKVVSMHLEGETKAREASLKAMELALREQTENDKRLMEQYQADLRALTDLQTKYMEVEAQAAGAADGNQEAFGRVQAQMVDLAERLEALAAPKVVERDDDGLIISVGGKTFKRDNEGRVVGIG